jgi:hypothetical protein
LTFPVVHHQEFRLSRGRDVRESSIAPSSAAAPTIMIPCPTIVATQEPVRRMARCVTNVLLKNWCGRLFIFQHEIVPVISVMHIRRDQSAFIGCCRLQRYTGETVLYFLSNDLLAKLSGGCDRAAAGFMPPNLQGRVGFECRLDHIRNIALNPYKQAIFLQLRVIKNSLVHYEIGAK